MLMGFPEMATAPMIVFSNGISNSKSSDDDVDDCWPAVAAVVVEAVEVEEVWVRAK